MNADDRIEIPLASRDSLHQASPVLNIEGNIERNMLMRLLVSYLSTALLFLFLANTHAANIEVRGLHQRTDGTIHNFDVLDGDALHPGDRFQVILSTDTQIYYSIVYVSRSGDIAQIFPPGNQPGIIVAGLKQYIPDSNNYFALDSNGGRELMYIITDDQILKNLPAVLRQAQQIGNAPAEIHRFLQGHFKHVDKMEIINTGKKIDGLSDNIAEGLVQDIVESYLINPWSELQIRQEEQDVHRRSADNSIPEEVRRRAREVRSLLRRPSGTPSSSSLRMVAVAQSTNNEKQGASGKTETAFNNTQKDAGVDLKTIADRNTGVSTDTTNAESLAAEREELERRERLLVTKMEREQAEAEARRLKEEKEAAQRLKEQHMAEAQAAEERLLRQREALAKAEAEAKRKAQLEARRIAEQKATREARRKEIEHVAAKERRKEAERIAAERAAAEVRRMDAQRLALLEAEKEARRLEKESEAAEAVRLEKERQEQEARRIAELKAVEEMRRLEEQRLAEKKRQEREARRIAELKAVEEARRLEEQKLAEIEMRETAARLEKERKDLEERLRAEQMEAEEADLQRIAASMELTENKPETKSPGLLNDVSEAGVNEQVVTGNEPQVDGAEETLSSEVNEDASVVSAKPREAIVVLQSEYKSEIKPLSVPASRKEAIIDSSPGEEQFRTLYARVASAIVSIRTGNNDQAAGFILSEQGNILTSWHVIKDVNDIEVKFMAISGVPRSYKARVIKHDKFRDLALLELVNPPIGIQPIQVAAMVLPDAGTQVRAFGQNDGRVWATDDAMITRVAENFTWFSASNVIHRGEILQVDLPADGKNIGSLITDMNYRMLGIKSFSGRQTGKTYAISARTINDFLNSE